MVAARRARAARCRRGGRALRTDRRDDVGRRHARLRNQQPRPRRAAKAATTSPTGATAIMPASAPARTAGGLACAPCATGSPRTSCPRVARNGHGIAEEAPLSPVEGADEALVMGLAAARRHRRRTRSPRASASERSSIGAGSSGSSRPAISRATARASRSPPAGRLVLDHILGEIAAAEPMASALLRAAAGVGGGGVGAGCRSRRAAAGLGAFCRP